MSETLRYVCIKNSRGSPYIISEFVLIDFDRSYLSYPDEKCDFGVPASDRS